MKKVLFMISAAAVAMTSCTSESNEYVGGNDNTPKEIAFFPLATPTTRAAVDGVTFPTTMGMQVAAFDVTNKREFFSETAFSYVNSKTYPEEAEAKKSWTGGTYWPLPTTYINIIAYQAFQGPPKT